MKSKRVLLKVVSAFIVLTTLLSTFLTPGTTQAFQPDPSGASEAVARAPAPGVLFRTHITVRDKADWARLEKMGIVFLRKGDSQALVLADDRQLEALARLRFEPRTSDELGSLLQAQGPAKAWLRAGLQPLLAKGAALQAQIRAAKAANQADTAALDAARADLRTAMHALTPEQIAGIASSISPDDDGDGLTNTQESWWCTDPLNPDTDSDGISDGEEIQMLKDWMANRRAGPPGGTPWPNWPFNDTTCPDKDHDSIPNLAERWELGLNMDLESTDHDKFDDGQELFGVTYCPGGDLSCGYGDLPRSQDSGYVGSTMPSWVKAPGNHPLVAAFPVPEVDAVESSFHVQTVTTVTTDHTIGSGTEKTYSTAKMKGTSTSVANTKTWNNWEEVSDARSTPVTSLSQQSNVRLSNTLINYNSTTMVVHQPRPKSSGLGLVGALVDTLEAPFKVWDIGRKYGEAINEGIFLATAYGAPWHWGGHLDEYDEMQAREQLAKCRSGQTCRDPATGALLLDGGPYAVKQQSSDQASQNFIAGNAGRYTALNDSGATSYAYRPVAVTLNMPPTATHTETKGKSWGGSETTTSSQYEENTITNGEAFSNSESWGNATAVDSAHAADLWFTYKVRNTGTEYAREIGDLTFNIYIGDDSNPAYTYHVANDVGGDGKFHNFMPDEEHTYTSAHIPLSLAQMKAIDLGGPLRIVVEDFSYGADELFYQDAVNADVMLAIEDGTDDGDEAIDDYLIPTWGDETVLDVLARYFPHATDEDGNLIAIWTPEYRSDTPAWCQDGWRPYDQPDKVLWCKHALSTADWWNIYTDGMGDGSEGFQDTPASPGAVALFRFNKDSDLDGYSDRSERKLGTDPNDPASYPHPELIAGMHSIRAGNHVTATLSLLNTGLYDAYGVEAVMIAPNDTISITNNTVGGSGRVRAQKQVIVGSRILLQSPLPDPWTQAGHAVPAAGGYYTGQQDRTYTFTVQCADPGGCDVGNGDWTLAWDDGTGNSGSLNFGAGYASPTFLDVGTLGVKLALYTGKVYDGESFTVDAHIPRDTFQYEIASGHEDDYTPPLVLVSYNDPQGNHRFLLPHEAMDLGSPTDNLASLSGKMLPDVGVEIVTSGPAQAGANSTDLVVTNPSDVTLTDSHLFLEFVNISGTVVSEVPVTTTVEPGPNVVTVDWNTADFDPAYDPDEDYIVMAFWTDYQGNILDTAARPLSSFQADPRPALAVDEADTTWDFGSVPQGTILTHTFTLADTGLMNLKAAVVGTGARAEQSVPGGAVWTDTGLEVAAGDALGIRAGGTVCYGGNGTSLCHGPDGDGNAAPADWTAPGASQFSLIGKIGNGSPFFVGSTYVGTADRDGRLYLGVNDRTGTYGDNGGSYQAHVEIQGIPMASQSHSGFSVTPADATNLDVTIDTYYLPAGPFDRTIMVRTSDPIHPTQALTVTGTVEPYVDPARAMAVSEAGTPRHPYRPWDQRVVVAGDHQAGDAVTFDDTIAADAANVHPLRVYNDTRRTTLGVGREAAGLSGQLVSTANTRGPVGLPVNPAHVRSEQATATSNMNLSGSVFGDGRDGVMPSSGNLDNNHGFGVGTVNGTAGSTTISVVDRHAVWRINPGDVVLIHQTQGTGAGNWELNKAVSNFTGSGTFTLERPLLHTYRTDSSNNHAQIIRVPQYSTCNVTGTVTPLAPWNGTWGGIFAVMCNDAINVTGKIDASGYGFRGGASGRVGSAVGPRHGFQGESPLGMGIQSHTENNGGGGGGQGDPWTGSGPNGGGAAGGGGGYGSVGASGQNGELGTASGGVGGYSYGTPTLEQLFLGPGGGGGGADNSYPDGTRGGNGGGITLVLARRVNISSNGRVITDGNDGQDVTSHDSDDKWGGAGGGGAGGSVLVKGAEVVLSPNSIEALGGRGGDSSNVKVGGNGGVGRIRIEYCNTFSGTTNPPASVAKVDFCYGTVTGTVFRDDNNSGTQDAGEPGMAGITAHLRSSSPARKVNTNLHGVLAEQSTTSAQQTGASGLNIFGDGRDGDLVVGLGRTMYLDDMRAAVVGTAAAGQNTIHFAVPTADEVSGRINLWPKWQWIDTGLRIAAGERLRVVADPHGHPDLHGICYGGSGNLCYDGNGISEPAPAGWTAPGIRKFSLVGRVGDGSPFFIGSNFDGVVNESGRLYLGLNDCNGCFGDNEYRQGNIGFTFNLRVGHSTAPQFFPGDQVLILQMTGNGAGNYELATIASLGQDMITLTSPLQNTYVGGGTSRAQIIRVPQYRSVVIRNGGVLTSRQWDGSTGGVIVFKVQDQLTVEDGGQISAFANGFGGGREATWSQPDAGPGYQGESYTGVVQSQSRSSNGGGGGGGQNAGGGGGGYGTPGQNGHEDWPGAPYGFGGSVYGSPTLGKIFLGSGGGGTGHVYEYAAQGGRGGGVIVIMGRNITVRGTLGANGQGGWQGHYGGMNFAPAPPVVSTRDGGGGSGGSIKLTAANLTIGTNRITALGGPGGQSTDNSGEGGSGGVGRIRIEYCDTFSGSTNPPASVAKGNFCYGTVTGAVFRDDNNSGTRDAGEPGMAGVTASLNSVGDTVTGNDGSYTFTGVPAPGDYTVSITPPSGTLNTTPTSVSCHLEPGETCTANFGVLTYLIEKVGASDHQNRFYLPESFHGGRRYWVQYGRKMVFDAAGQQQANVQLPMAHYGSATMDIWLTEPVSSNASVQLALDVGCDGTSEWSKNAHLSIPTVLSTDDLALGINRFLETATPDANGMVDVPLCVTSNIAGTFFLTNLVATPDGLSDVTPTDVNFGSTSPVEGDAVTVQATLHNSTVWDSGGLTASFFATPPGGREWYIGSAFVSNVPAGGTAQASIDWDTLGFTGDVPVRVVVDPYDRVAETDEANNEITATLTILTRPDLSIPAIQLSDDEPVAGEAVTVTLPISNSGQTAAGAQTVALYVGNPDAGGTLVGATGLSPLPGGGTDTVAFTWTPAAPGKYRLFARADRDDAVNESDEGNNQTWQDVYVGLAAPVLLDSGDPSADPPYTPALGYGVVDEGQRDVTGSCGSLPYQSFRRDPTGKVVYRFDYLQPGHFYHLDVTLYECDDAKRQEMVKVDGYPVSELQDLGDEQPHRLSIRLDPALYADRSITVTVEAPGIDGAIVNEVNLYDIDYRYADAGGNNDPGYPGSQGYGWLDGVPNTAWGTLPYQSVRVEQSDNELRYRFDGLTMPKAYDVHLTFWEGSGTSRDMVVRIDGQSTGTTVHVTAGEDPQEVMVPVPVNAYRDDGTIVVSIMRTDASVGAFVNEIALEEETLNPPKCSVAQTPYFTEVYGEITISGAPAPAGTLVEALNPRGEVVGCFVTTEEGIYGLMRIYGEDTSVTPPIPGMRDGEEVMFRVNGQYATSTPVLVWHNDRQSHHVVIAAGAEAQAIPLSSGWHLMSFRLLPSSLAVQDVMSSVGGKYDRVMGEYGTYDPSLPSMFNTLQEIHPASGYWVHMTEAATFSITGTVVPASSPIPLHQSWNWIGYLPEQALGVVDALVSIDGKYTRVIGDRGTFDATIPPTFNTLQDMRPGEGYLLYATQPVTLTYPGSGTSSSIEMAKGVASEDSNCTSAEDRTTVFMETWGYVVPEECAPAGAVVTAHRPDGTQVGCFTVSTAGAYGLMRLYGKDPNTPGAPGLESGDKVSFRINGVPVEATPRDGWDMTWDAARDSRSVHEVELQCTGSETPTATPTATATPATTPSPTATATLTPVVTQDVLSNTRQWMPLVLKGRKRW